MTIDMQPPDPEELADFDSDAWGKHLEYMQERLNSRAHANGVTPEDYIKANAWWDALPSDKKLFFYQMLQQRQAQKKQLIFIAAWINIDGLERLWADWCAVHRDPKST